MAKVLTHICMRLLFSFFLFFLSQFMFLSFLKTKKFSLAVCLGGGWGGCNQLQQELSEAVLQNKMKPPDLY